MQSNKLGWLYKLGTLHAKPPEINLRTLGVLSIDLFFFVCVFLWISMTINTVDDVDTVDTFDTVDTPDTALSISSILSIIIDSI